MFLQQTQPVSGDQSQALQQEELDKSTSGAGEGAAGWQGWLTGWYSWYGTDTTDGLSGGRPEKDASPVFMGEPPTTKGSSATMKLPHWVDIKDSIIGYKLQCSQELVSPHTVNFAYSLCHFALVCLHFVFASSVNNG